MSMPVEQGATPRTGGAPGIRRLTMDEPWKWLAAGWGDLWAKPTVSLAYGLGFAVISAALVAGLTVLELTSLVLALGGGFMILGPMLAVGMYEASRRREQGQPIVFKDVLLVKTRSPAQIAFLGAVLMIVFLVWMRIATLLFALFFGLGGFPPIDEFLPMLLFTWQGVGLLVTGSMVGAVLAFIVFAVSAISVPMLMVRDMDAVTAIVTSFQTVLRNPGAMLLWAWLIALFMAVGIATLFVGLIVIFPLIGHATWHAYRAAIED